MPYLKRRGHQRFITSAPRCSSLKGARSIGCDASGRFRCFEWVAPGPRMIFPTLILLPARADELEIPFVASGAMADARLAGRCHGAGRRSRTWVRALSLPREAVHEKRQTGHRCASELDYPGWSCVACATPNGCYNSASSALSEGGTKRLARTLQFSDIVDEWPAFIRGS